MSSDSDSESDQGAQVRVSLKLAAFVQDRSLEVRRPSQLPFLLTLDEKDLLLF